MSVIEDTRKVMQDSSIWYKAERWNGLLINYEIGRSITLSYLIVS